MCLCVYIHRSDDVMEGMINGVLEVVCWDWAMKVYATWWLAKVYWFSL